jgi:ribosome biogenesis GTPase / thiamine phosphate phosphatase
MSEHQGIVLRAQSGRYVVLDDAGTATCRARRRLERADPSWPEFPVPGDQVRWRLLGGAGNHRDGVIEAVQPRQSEIARTRFGAKHVLLANLDRLVVVVAVRYPTLDRGLLDRLLAAAEHVGVEALVCLHKIDLLGAAERTAEITPLQATYTSAGYAVLCTSAEDGTGIDTLREALRGHVSGFMGPSGAGKSRLIGLLQPGLKLHTGAVSEKTGQGRHTTTRVDLHRTEFGALLADTPGVRDFGLWQVDPVALGALFPEIRALQDRCHYAGCTHIPEPQCGVKAAVEAGEIDRGRYRSYCAIFSELHAVATDALDREGRGR